MIFAAMFFCCYTGRELRRRLFDAAFAHAPPPPRLMIRRAAAAMMLMR